MGTSLKWEPCFSGWPASKPKINPRLAELDQPLAAGASKPQRE